VAHDAVGERRHRDALTVGGRLPPYVVVPFAAVIVVVSAEGGYFPSSWGWTTTALLWAIGVWIVVSGRCEAGRLDLLFFGLCALLTGWIGLSAAWSLAPALSVLELERAFLLLTGVAALLVLARVKDLPNLIGAMLAAITMVSAYGLATRLFPDRLGSEDAMAVYRLSEPIGYWNGLGIFAVMGLLVAVAIVAEGARAWSRALAAVSIVVLATTLYFTYSRGSWVALAAGFLLALALSPRRLRLVAGASLAAVPAAIAVLVASRSSALTHRDAALQQAVDDGRRFALVLVALCVVAAAAGVLLHAVDCRATVPRAGQIGLGATLWVAGSIAVILLAVRVGGPLSIAELGWDEFASPPPRETADLNSRLLSFSGNGRVDLWRAANDVWTEHRLAGGGAGSFERFWQMRDDASLRVRDAHGLYVETFAELGVIGLALLVAALAVPLAGAVRARRRALVAAVAGAYAAFLVHAGADWDWELAGVTLTALLLGASLVIAARRTPVRTMPTRVRAAIGVAVGLASIAAIVAGLGNSALESARDAIDRRDTHKAIVEADRANRLMPWSPEPWIERGEAELLAGDTDAAARSFRRAIDVDDRHWLAWLDLAIATDGPTRVRALDRARALYPTSTEIARIAARLQP
jgi:O-Antigen ligase